METDKVFAGPIPQLYDRHLGPILFQPFAEVIAERLREADRVILETAAGTGIVTRAMAAAVPQSNIVATDLNQAMLDVAAGKIHAGHVTWQQADAQSLPFPDASFDVVICSFGVMFMPDKQAAYREARRVLRSPGRFLFTLWDRIDANPPMAIADETVAGLFPDDPPHFLARTPCGYTDKARIEQVFGRGASHPSPSRRSSDIRRSPPRGSRPWGCAKARPCAGRSRRAIQAAWFVRPRPSLPQYANASARARSAHPCRHSS